MKLIIGLGNPEPEYATTRHNTGFLVIDEIINKKQLTINKTPKLQADVAKGEINKKRVLLAKPLTYMNNSGIAVRALMDFYKLKPADLIIIHDDKDIPLGETRVQADRGPAGHNGIKSIIEHLGTQDFLRIRVGVAPGNQDKIKDTANFVLGKFTAAELKTLKKVTENIAKELEQIIM